MDTVSEPDLNLSADSTSVVPDNSNLTQNETLKNKKFIRTAESKFRVKDVKQTTQKIHDLTNKYGGVCEQYESQKRIN